MEINKAFLSNWNEFKIIKNNQINEFDFFVNNEKKDVRKLSSDNKFLTYQFDEIEDILGKELFIKYDNEVLFIDKSEMPKRKDFDHFYALNSDCVLGPVCSDTQTIFNLWAPLATEVILLIENKEFNLVRKEKGLFKTIIKGNLDGKLYLYRVKINGQTYDLTDPYCLASDANRKHSVVVDKEKHKFDSNERFLKKIDNYLEAIIYECHVRDMTIDKTTNIVNKGKYLGLIEKDKKTKAGNPAGFDYLNYLKFSHLQLQPILDFGSVDELGSGYNWGYDPISFFCLEGSYSVDPNNPFKRIEEFQNVVSEFHKMGKRINIDVVYNHVYIYEKVDFAIITPNYYFRFENGKMANHSWCGNDFASERAMARKLILDSVKNLVEFYSIDGLRFDLMGLLDIETMKLIAQYCKSKKPGFMLYGEGWDMFAVGLNGEKMAHLNNSELLPEYAFFNDRYRNIVRGSGSKAELDEKGYLLGNVVYKDGFKFAYFGSSFDLTFPKLFKSLNQSLNYVECHDNATIHDVIENNLEHYNLSRMIKIFNKTLLFSFGIPFIHMGQEIGLTKHGQHNTYNMGDYFNAFDYSILDKRFDLIHSLNSYINTRENLKIFKENNIDVVDKNVDYIDHSGVMEIVIKDEKTYHIFINPFNKPFEFSGRNKLELFIPNRFKRVNDDARKIVLDIPENRCSIFVEKR